MGSIPSTYRFACSIVRFGISSSSARHQLVISSSSARHQFVISSSSEKKRKRENEKKRKREKEKKEKDSRNGLGRAPTYNRKILRRVSTQLDILSICHTTCNLSTVLISIAKRCSYNSPAQRSNPSHPTQSHPLIALKHERPI